MTNQPEKGWWEEDLVALLNCEYTGEQHNFMRKVIAEATRRGKVDLLMEMQKMVVQLKTEWLEGAEGLTEESDKEDYFDDGWDQGGKVALLVVSDQINSRIQQYGKEE